MFSCARGVKTPACIAITFCGCFSLFERFIDTESHGQQGAIDWNIDLCDPVLVDFILNQDVVFSCQPHFETFSRNISNFVPRNQILRDLKKHILQ